MKKTIKEEELRHRQATLDMAHEVSSSFEKYVQSASTALRRLCKLEIQIPLELLGSRGTLSEVAAVAVGMHRDITGHRVRWLAQVEELQLKDVEQRERLKSNLAVLAELQREVAHWRSRIALAAREWAEREESLASERAGKRPNSLAHMPAIRGALRAHWCVRGLLAAMSGTGTEALNPRERCWQDTVKPEHAEA